MGNLPTGSTPRQVWTPRGRTSRQLRNARVKVVGSVALLAALAVAVLVALL